MDYTSGPRMMRSRAAGATLLLLLGLWSIPSAAEVAALRISQASQGTENAKTVRAYLEVLDRDGDAVRYVEPEGFSASVGEQTARLTQLAPLETTGQGVAYVFLVDISKSLSRAEFDRILDALDRWLDTLGPRDRAAVIAFGEQSRLLVDFTADYSEIRSALYALGPTDDLTVFHGALWQALELAKRRDPDLPGRRALVVLTDGRDEGSGYSAEDVLAAIRRDPCPIYAIGLSRIRDPEERKHYLNLLGRFASNSGGAFVEADAEAVGASYATLQQAVRRVWVADFECPDCRADGATYRFQIQLAENGRVLSDGLDVRLLPGSPADEPVAAPQPEVSQPAQTVETDVAPVAAGTETEKPRGSILWIVLAALAALLFLAFAVATAIGRKRKDQQAEPEPKEELREVAAQPAPFASTGPYESAPGVLTSRPPRPVELRLIRLVVVRGSRPGRQYNMTLMESGTIGSRSTCDCVLVEEPGVEPEQFELYQFDGLVYIRDRAEVTPTLVDGHPIGERHHLPNDSLVGTSDFIARVLYDQPSSL